MGIVDRGIQGTEGKSLPGSLDGGTEEELDFRDANCALMEDLHRRQV